MNKGMYAFAKDMENVRKYCELLKPLFEDYNKEFKPAGEKQIFDFKEKCTESNVPVWVQEQLIEFYSITNGVPCLNSFAFHEIDDEILFEWWGTDNELWFGTKDDDILRWAHNKFCLGDASNSSYSDEYEFDTLIELFEKVFAEWNYIQ